MIVLSIATLEDACSVQDGAWCTCTSCCLAVVVNLLLAWSHSKNRWRLSKRFGLVGTTVSLFEKSNCEHFYELFLCSSPDPLTPFC